MTPLKKTFTLTTTQFILVDSAVYIAYFLIALPVGYVMREIWLKGRNRNRIDPVIKAMVELVESIHVL